MTLQAVIVKKSRLDTFTVLALDARAEQLTEKQSSEIGKKHMNLRSKTVLTNKMLTLTFFTIFCSNKILMISCVGKRTELYETLILR